MGQIKHPCIFLLSLLVLACSGSRQTAQEEDSRSQRAPLSRYEATLNPSDFDEEISVVQKSPKEDSARAELNIPKDSVVVEEEASEGFRIQIYASASIDDANTNRSIATQRLAPDSVYVVYDPPVYKVRVGDFPTRYEANQRLPLLIEKGYPDAWVVQDRIVQRKVTRIPRQ